MSNIKLFEQKEIRSYWNETEGQWYFSVVDIVEALTDSVNATDYLKKLRKRDSALGSYIGTNCAQVEMLTNGKKRMTLAGTVKDIFRIIQSIPLPQHEFSRFSLLQLFQSLCIYQTFHLSNSNLVKL